MYLIFNGQFIDESAFHVGLDNRAFSYGDGVFETIVAFPHKVNYLSDHLERLSSGIKTLGMILPKEINQKTCEELIKELIVKNNLDKARVKILVWRKSGGFFTPQSNDAEFIITASRFIQPPAQSEKVFIYDNVRIPYSGFSKFKTLSSLPYVMAGIAKKELNADDLILLDTEGNIAEGLVSNLFWIKGNNVFTPSIETGCKEGVMRKQILSFLDQNKIQCNEGKFRKEDLLSADFAFTSNVTGIVAILKLEDIIYHQSSELFNKIHSYFNFNSPS
jgi:4-amino-4-deoxychorismate lyase